MQKQRAFTVIELMVVIAIIAVIVGLLFPAIGAVRRHAKQTESNVRVRNIVQALVQASDSRRGFFPGFDGSAFIIDGPTTTGNSGRGQTAEARFWILLDGSFTSADQVISPQESKIEWTTGRVREENYSYAMLQIADSNNTSAAANANDRFRREEWRNQQNAQAPLVTDRLANAGNVLPTPGAPQGYLSIHDGSAEGDWIGSIGHGDLSVEFSDSATVETRIAGQYNSQDDIFFTGGGATPDPAKNAAVTYRGYNDPAGDFE